ncbi:MAG: exodeoxyribonuclease VII large subunit [Pseudomonadota bacterium]
MDELFEDAEPSSNSPELSVSEISGAVKRVIEGEFGRVRVRGEVGRVSRPRSGHVYLDLKDDRNVLAGVVWKGAAQRLATQPEEGIEVVATGRLTTFGGQSRYQMVIEDIRPAGVGALMAMLEKRKAALAAEGLFDEARKQALPFLPDVIGVITSPSGAVIRDILHRLRDRFPRKVLVWPVAVQGARCAPEVAQALAGFNRLQHGGALPRPDLLIVARGGGSIEDLWGFNEESVARAVAASAIPVISAVGHETDTTLVDFVADRRAPTPSAAAEMAVPVRMELLAWVDGQNAWLTRGVSQAVLQRRQRLNDLARALPRPEALVAGAGQRLDYASARLPRALEARRQAARARIAAATGILRPGVLRGALSARKTALGQLASRLMPALARQARERQRRLEAAALRMRPAALARDVTRADARAREVGSRLFKAALAQNAALRRRLDGLERLRQTLGYRETLKRGYAVIRGDGAVVTTKATAAQARGLEIEFADGRLQVGGRPARRGKADEPPEQGSLF